VAVLKHLHISCKWNNSHFKNEANAGLEGNKRLFCSYNSISTHFGLPPKHDMFKFVHSKLALAKHCKFYKRQCENITMHSSGTLFAGVRRADTTFLQRKHTKNDVHFLAEEMHHIFKKGTSSTASVVPVNGNKITGNISIAEKNSERQWWGTVPTVNNSRPQDMVFMGKPWFLHYLLTVENDLLRDYFAAGWMCQRMSNNCNQHINILTVRLNSTFSIQCQK